MNRRSFLVASTLSLGAFTLLKGPISFAKEELKLKDSDVAKNGDKLPVAQYCENAEKDHKACPERAKPERKGQECANCQFYTAKGKFKGQDVGTCTLIPGKHVYGKAWCQTWVKKVG